MGRLIVLEGIDGSGKSTQLKRLADRLSLCGRDFMRLSFPRYSEPSSALVRMYLAGDFGTSPGDVNAYAASTFFAVDRYASYRTAWRAYLDSGGMVLTDRYTTSNAIHQGAKLNGDERDSFFRWLYDFEFNLLKLPAPDAVIYLNIPVGTARARILRRDLDGGDIHERDTEYLVRCAECGADAVRFYGWHTVNCVADGAERSEDDVHEEIYNLVLKISGE